MRLPRLSQEAQDGLRLWAAQVHDNQLLFDDIGSLPEHWAWVWFQLRVSKDKPEWFPKGKWATIQTIEAVLNEEAVAFVAFGP